MEVSTVSYLCVYVCTVFNPDFQVSMFYLYSPQPALGVFKLMITVY